VINKTKLLIGSGEWHWQEYVTIDGNPANEPDICAMLPPLPDEVMSQKFTEVVASHIIEHFFKQDALIVLKQCYDVLLPEGLLILEQPDLAYCCKVIAGVIQPPDGRSVEQFGWWGVFGNSSPDEPLMGHRWGYTPQSLSDMVVDAGFNRENITIVPGVWHEPARDFQLRVTR